MLSITVSSTSIIVVGGINQNDDDILNVEVFSDTANNTCNITDLEITIADNPMVFTAPISDNLLVCGGNNNRRRCLTLDDDGLWTYLALDKMEISKLNSPRRMSSAATTSNASFIFGGIMGAKTATYDYMLSSAKNWVQGNKTIPDGFKNGCAITISDDEIWLIGGEKGKQKTRVLAFYPSNHTFSQTGIELTRSRHSHRCSLMPDKSGVMVTGGTSDSTEIIDIETRKSSESGNLSSVRALHGIGTLVINDTPTLVVFGGYTWASGDRKEEYFTTFEKYDEKTKTWSLWKDTKLKLPRREFGFATLKHPLKFCRDAKN